MLLTISEKRRKTPVALTLQERAEVGILSDVCRNGGENTEQDLDENADQSFCSASSDVSEDPTPLDARKALKTLQRFTAKNLFGVAPMDALMKLEICMTDAKIEGYNRLGSALPELE